MIGLETSGGGESPWPEGAPDLAADSEVERVCRRVAVAAEFSLSLLKRPEIPRVRSVVADCLSFGLEPGSEVRDVQLIVGELVGNAYRHAAHPLALSVVRQVRSVLLEVTDDGVDVERVTGRPADAGYGLVLVEQLALDWGARPVGAGKVVWALLPLRSP